MADRDANNNVKQIVYFGQHHFQKDCCESKRVRILGECVAIYSGSASDEYPYVVIQARNPYRALGVCINSNVAYLDFKQILNMEHQLNDMDCEGVMPPVFRGLTFNGVRPYIKSKDLFFDKQMEYAEAERRLDESYS